MRPHRRSMQQGGRCRILHSALFRDRGGDMRLVTLTVSGTPTGKAWTWAYPEGRKLGIFEMPTYELSVTGTNDGGSPVRETFKVFRFGVQCTDGKSAKVVGL